MSRYMASKQPRPRQPSYAWALDPGPTHGLSDAALDGLDYAAQLAEDSRNRIHQMLRREPEQLPPLTINDLADSSNHSPATIRRRITRARTELYRDLSDAGIRYRRRRRKHLAQRPDRPCSHPGCTNQLPHHSTANRKYCDTHNTPAARTARSRAKHAG